MPKGMTGIQETVVFKSDELQDGAKGLRFALPALGEFATGFVIRFHGKPYAYVNQCAHVAVELDWRHTTNTKKVAEKKIDSINGLDKLEKY